MGLKQSIARLFGKGATPRSAGSRSAASAPAREPVNIDVYLDENEQDPSDDSLIAGAMTESPTSSSDAAGAPAGVEPLGTDDSGEDDRERSPILAPRNRQELVKELQKNYAEVLGLVRKVDDHLDTQTHRSERLLELACPPAAVRAG